VVGGRGTVQVAAGAEEWVAALWRAVGVGKEEERERQWLGEGDEERRENPRNEGMESLCAK
jgi:hypothetical protein